MHKVWPGAFHTTDEPWELGYATNFPEAICGRHWARPSWEDYLTPYSRGYLAAPSEAWVSGWESTSRRDSSPRPPSRSAHQGGARKRTSRPVPPRPPRSAGRTSGEKLGAAAAVAPRAAVSGDFIKVAEEGTEQRTPPPPHAPRARRDLTKGFRGRRRNRASPRPRRGRIAGARSRRASPRRQGWRGPRTRSLARKTRLAAWRTRDSESGRSCGPGSRSSGPGPRCRGPRAGVGTGERQGVGRSPAPGTRAAGAGGLRQCCPFFGPLAQAPAQGLRGPGARMARLRVTTAPAPESLPVQ
ncbi:hypothetical protein ACSSS7_005424 [Eimeria intestinalis]